MLGGCIDELGCPTPNRDQPEQGRQNWPDLHDGILQQLSIVERVRGDANQNTVGLRPAQADRSASRLAIHPTVASQPAQRVAAPRTCAGGATPSAAPSNRNAAAKLSYQPLSVERCGFSPVLAVAAICAAVAKLARLLPEPITDAERMPAQEIADVHASLAGRLYTIQRQ